MVDNNDQTMMDYDEQKIVDCGSIFEANNKSISTVKKATGYENSVVKQSYCD